MKKKGFVSMTLVYSFLTIFLFVMAAIMASQAEKSNYVEFINNKVNEDLDSLKSKSSSITKRILEDNFVTDGSIFVIGNVANKAIGNGNGLYYLNSVDENADGKVSRIYFFRGHVDNNFAKINDMCFRIIRTNEDGNVRMMYLGRDASGCNSIAYNGTGDSDLVNKKFNLLGDDNAFVGYMFGKAQSQLHDISATSVDDRVFANRIDVAANRHTEYEDTHNFYEYDLTKSTSNESGYRFFYVVDNKVEYFENQSNAKKLLDAWFEKNSGLLSSMVTDSSFCINRTLASGSGVGAAATNYNVSTVNYSANPFRCAQDQDRLSLSKFKGGYNEAYNSLEYPVGLVTVDDVLYAGGGFAKNNNDYYLNTGQNYWTMSPAQYSGGAFEVTVSSSGSISSASVTFESARYYPVLSIDGNTLVTGGKGTSDDPYVLESASITYTIEYRGNGATDGTMISTTLRLDEEAKLRKNTYTREGYTFKGWATDNTSNTVKYNDEAQVKNLSYTKGATVELFAVWEAN